MQTKVNLERILFVEIDKMKVEFPDENWYSNEEMKASPEFKYSMDAMKQACKEVLELAAERAEMETAFNYGGFNEKTAVFDKGRCKVFSSETYGHGTCGYEAVRVSKQSINDTINDVE